MLFLLAIMRHQNWYMTNNLHFLLFFQPKFKSKWVIIIIIIISIRKYLGYTQDQSVESSLRSFPYWASKLCNKEILKIHFKYIHKLCFFYTRFKDMELPSQQVSTRRLFESSRSSLSIVFTVPFSRILASFLSLFWSTKVHPGKSDSENREVGVAL